MYSRMKIPSKQEVHQLVVGQAKRRATKILHKAVGGGILGRSFNFDKCWLKVADDVIFGVAVD